MGRIFAALLVVLLSWPTRAAYAFVDPPATRPSNPGEFETVYVWVTMGECDAVIYDAQAPSIAQKGNAIRILFDSVHEFDHELCFLPEFTTKQAIGRFPAGNYTQQVDRKYPGLTRIVTEKIADLNFAVASTGATSVPVLSAIGQISLVTLLIALAALVLRIKASLYLSFGARKNWRGSLKKEDNGT